MSTQAGENRATARGVVVSGLLTWAILHFGGPYHEAFWWLGGLLAVSTVMSFITFVFQGPDPQKAYKRQTFGDKWRRFRRRQGSDVHGKARFATQADLAKAKLISGKGAPLGLQNGDLVRRLLETTMVVIGGSGSGKTTTMAQPMIMLDKSLHGRRHAHTDFIWDESGELTETMAPIRRAQGDEVIIIDLTGRRTGTHTINVLDHVFDGFEKDERQGFQLATETAEFLKGQTKDEKNPYFANNEKLIAEFTIGFLGAAHIGAVSDDALVEAHNGLRPPGRPTMTDMARLLADDVLMRMALNDALESQACGGALKVKAQEVLGALRAKQAHEFMVGVRILTTPFIPGTILAGASAASSFKLCDARRKRTAIFIIMDESSRDACAAFSRLLINHILNTSKTNKGRPWRFIIDEAGSLKLPKIVTIATAYRKYNVSLVLFYQDLDQIEMAEGRLEAATLLAQAEIVVVLRTSGISTARYVSERSGYKTAMVPGTNEAASGVSESYSAHKIPLVSPEQVINTPPEIMYVLLAGDRALRLRKLPYSSHYPHALHCGPNTVRGDTAPWLGLPRVIWLPFFGALITPFSRSWWWSPKIDTKPALAGLDLLSMLPWRPLLLLTALAAVALTLGTPHILTSSDGLVCRYWGLNGTLLEYGEICDPVRLYRIDLEA